MTTYEVKYRVERDPWGFLRMRVKYRKQGKFFYDEVVASDIDLPFYKKDPDLYCSLNVRSISELEYSSPTRRAILFYKYINTDCKGDINKTLNNIAEEVVIDDVKRTQRCKEADDIVCRFLTNGWQELTVSLTDENNET